MPHLALLLATLLWSSSSAVGKIGIQAMPAGEILALRFWIGTAVIASVILLLHGRLPRIDRIALWAFLASIFSPGLATLVTYWALLHTTALHAIVVFACAPVTTAVVARTIIKEPLSGSVLIGAGIRFGGILVLVSNQPVEGIASWFGDLLCVAGLLISSLVMTLLLPIARDFSDPLTLTVWQLAGGGNLCFLSMALFESWLDSRGWVAVGGMSVWLLVIYLSIFVSAATYFLYNYGLRHLPTIHNSLYYMLMAPLGIPMAALIVDEPILPKDVLAVVLVAAGVAYPLLASAVRNRRFPG